MNPEHLSQNPPHTSQNAQPSTQANPPSSRFRLTDTGPQHVRWLWPGRIPLGKLTLLEGSPGSGTSLFAIHLAACLSSGSPWPDGTPCQQGNVLIIAPHDNFRDTIVHRLEAAGANSSHCFSLSQVFNDNNEPSTINRTHPFSLLQDRALLETVIRQMEVRLLIFDPFSAIPGSRRSLLDLVQLAQRSGCAILLTSSLRQAPADPIRAQGPTSPVRTAARSCLLLAPDPANEHKHLLLTSKHSLCAPSDILSYELAVTDQGIPILHWLGQRDLTQLARLSTGPIRSPHRQAILRFLRESSTACSIKDLIHATSYDYEAGRKMIVRMRMAGELISPARGLYTTPDHPCLASFSTPQPDSTASAVSNVPTVPNSSSPADTPQPDSTPSTDPTIPDPDSTLSADPTDPSDSSDSSDPNSDSPTDTPRPDSTASAVSTVPTVPNSDSPTDTVPTEPSPDHTSTSTLASSVLPTTTPARNGNCVPNVPDPPDHTNTLSSAISSERSDSLHIDLLQRLYHQLRPSQTG